MSIWVSRLPLPSKEKMKNPEKLTEAIMTNTVGQLPDVWRIWLIKETPTIPAVRKENKIIYCTCRSIMHPQINF